MHAIRRTISLCASGAFAAGETVAADIFGSTPYLQRNDTAAAFLRDSVHIEEPEGGQIDPRRIPVTPASLIDPGGLDDSVDADEGQIDGSGINASSPFRGIEIRIQFESPVV